MSLQLEHYLAIRAEGDPPETAALRVGFSMTEARLTEKAIESGDLTLPRARAHARTRENQPTREANMALEDVKTSISVNGGPQVDIDLKKDLDAPENAGAREQMGAMFGQPATDAGKRLKSYIERAERLDAEIKDLNEDKSELFQEAKANGFDTKAIKQIIKLRKMKPHDRQTAEAMLSTYMNAIGMTPIEQAIALAA